MQTVGGSLHRTLNRLFVDVRCGNGSRRVRAVIQIDSSIHLVKGALPRYGSVIYNWLPECVRTCRCLFQHHRYPLSSAFFHPWITTCFRCQTYEPSSPCLAGGFLQFLFSHRRFRERSRANLLDSYLIILQQGDFFCCVALDPIDGEDNSFTCSLRTLEFIASFAFNTISL